MQEQINAKMSEYIESTMKNLSGQIKSELELAFLTGVQAGLAEGKRISDNVFEQWEGRNDSQYQAH